jgi:predicted ATP-dependent endonuclease of OLD family
MIIGKVFIRFYRAFNYDYLRKSHTEFQPKPWDKKDEDTFFPFVKVPLEAGITTIVGANESGKSQLLSAIQCGLSGADIERGDFCRYSQFFSVSRAMEYPQFGLEFFDLDPPEREVVRESCNINSELHFTKFLLFRLDRNKISIYIPNGDDWSIYEVLESDKIEEILPRPFVINAKIPLPSSVPIRYLASGKVGALRRRRNERHEVLGALQDNEIWFSSLDNLNASASQILETFGVQNNSDTENEEMKLADDLLTKVAGIDRSAFEELLKAIRNGREGYANGIVEKINREIASSLNFPNWWSQDKEFELRVTLRDYDLVLTVRDRTRTEYSFSERSGGLKYFLSYFVQYLAHMPPADGNSEVLLMDEPDAYLSSTGQQDLLKIFESFAYPEEPSRPPCQVVYVTHSPFLIDKNHGERIRVLEKGEEDEGVRVVGSVARNHYEPLRSAFGGFVGETTFISNCNLMLEGLSEQIILAGVSSFLRSRGHSSAELLDLNTITLVPAGSAGQIPYLVHLARGRDAERPAVIVLLDSDKAGDDARKELKKRQKGAGKAISDDLVIQLGDLADRDVKFTNTGNQFAIEDLIPFEILISAGLEYVDEYLGSASRARIDPATFAIGSSQSHQSVEKLFCDSLEDSSFHLDKIGLARSIIKVLTTESLGSHIEDVIIKNFLALFKALRGMQSKAMRQRLDEGVSMRIKRMRRAFLRDHPRAATGDQCDFLLNEIESFIAPSLEFDELQKDIRKIRNEFINADNAARKIDNYESFQAHIEQLALLERKLAQGNALISD